MKTIDKRFKYLKEQKALFSFLTLLILMTSCRKFVVIPPPTTQLVTASVFNNDASATSAVLNIYSNMFSNQVSTNLSRQNGLLADELTAYTKSGSLGQSYLDAMTSIQSSGGWANYYNYIYQANAVIQGLQTYSGTSPAVKRQLEGESYFIRAYFLFCLTNGYGAVPIVTTQNYATNLTLSRSPQVQVLQQVVSDLKIAQNLLNNNYVDLSDTTITTDKIRPNKATATALLARAYLYLGDYSHDPNAYAKADSASTAVINNNLYGLSSLSDIFLIDSKEAIWQIATPQPANLNTREGNTFILLGAPNSGNVTISPQLLNAFEPNDQRLTSWVGTLTKNGITYYFPYKYKVQSGGTPLTEYTMVLRLAEQYLILAEAKVHEGDLQAAAANLNIIRQRAGLPNTSAVSATGLMTAILHERQVELFTEWGHRWFDLNRTGNTPLVLGPPGNVCQFKGGTWNADLHQELYPIPIGEIQADPKITQNPGY